MEAIDSLDIDKLVTTHTNDLVEILPEIQPVVGKEAYRKIVESWFNPLQKVEDYKYTFNITELEVYNNVAFARGVLGFFGSSIKMKLKLNLKGNYVWILKKLPNGDWKIFRGISNLTKPQFQSLPNRM